MCKIIFFLVYNLKCVFYENYELMVIGGILICR